MEVIYEEILLISLSTTKKEVLKMYKKVFFILILISLIMLVSFLSDAKTIIRIGTAYETNHIHTRVAQKFKDIVEAETDEIEVQIFPSSSLGSEEEILQQVCAGSIEMQSGGLMAVDSYAHEYSFFDTPYLWKSFNHWMNAWNSELGVATRNTVAQRGNTIYLGVIYVGMRHTTANKPLKTIQDFRGLKIRVPMVPAWVEIWKGLGANPIPISLPELFTALQTGTAEASEGPAGQILSFKLYEVQDYLILTSHTMQAGDLTICKDFYEQLNPSMKKLVETAGLKACKWGTEVAMAEEEELISQLISKGMKKIIPDTKSLQEKAVSTLERLFEKNWPTATLEQILAFTEE